MMKGWKHFREVRDDEKAATELLDEVQERKLQLEDELWQELDNYIFTWEPGKRRSASLNAKNLATGSKQPYKSGEPGA